MNSVQKLQSFTVLAALAALGTAAGCKSTPPLSKDQALALIQAKYDSMPPVPVNIVVNDLGMQEGVNAKYWVGVKRYPNGYWGDFKLTPDGRKVLALASGGDTIQWRPDGPLDPHYAVGVLTVISNHLKAKDIGDIQDQPGVGETANYSECVVLTGVPDALQGIASNPGNQLSTRRTATFVLTGGQWMLQSIN